MGWTDLVTGVNALVASTFQSSTYPTVTFTPASGGGPHSLATVEREVQPIERTSAGNVTSLFFDSVIFSPTTAIPLPKIGDLMTWQGVSYRVVEVAMDSERGFRVALRKSS